ncbi:stalk domain-containing protein [Chengkuizengella axinellae]|uniref:Stalk domain-containing protein n=1 Tax=Chengkuizengella axinellae TaxID=3064388 RepID=A0ABT9IUI3_9BACL|nr:stalk domain-containing protein [Chengkuizengella sp. 2205SS18-9]MDP5273005.1 stalk domain-containing protein [Chengkuizengella sp. 2205SS18-9]
MKKLLLLIIFILAISSTVIAMAFNGSLNDEPLAIHASEYHAAVDEVFDDSDQNRYVIDVNLNRVSHNVEVREFGIQPNSLYTWNELFKLKNNSDIEMDNIKIGFEPKVGNDLSFLNELGLKVRNGTENEWFTIDEINHQFLLGNLISGQEEWIDIQVDQFESHASKGFKNFNIVVYYPNNNPDEDDPDQPKTKTTVSTSSSKYLEIYLYLDKANAVVNGNEVYIDPNNMNVRPFILDDRTFLPMRFLSEALGAEVEWDGPTDTVTITEEDRELILVIGEKTIWINGEAVEIDVAPVLTEDERTFLPVRAVAEALGRYVNWYDGLVFVTDRNIELSESKKKNIINEYFIDGIISRIRSLF